MRKKLQNFWFYYKKHLLIGLAALLVLLYLGIQKCSTAKPDYHIGLVRAAACTEAELKALEDAFTAAGTDVNGDGQVLVQIHTYFADLAGAPDADVIQALDADLIGGMSGLFLLEDVDTFRAVTGGILTDGAIPMDGGLFLTIRANASDAYMDLAGKMTRASVRPVMGRIFYASSMLRHFFPVSASVRLSGWPRPA